MKKIPSSEITNKNIYLKRRRFIKGGFAALLSMISSSAFAFHKTKNENLDKVIDKGDILNSFEQITTYNNYYEFGMGKSDPSQNSHDFKPIPWSVIIEGLVEKPGTLNLEDLLKDITIEDRIYRLRCVEGWSMVIPWQGFSLNKLISKVKPLSNAKYIQFETVFRPNEMSGQRK